MVFDDFLHLKLCLLFEIHVHVQVYNILYMCMHTKRGHTHTATWGHTHHHVKRWPLCVKNNLRHLTKRGLYDISYHNSWYRSRKIIAQQKEKNLPFNLSLYLSQSNVRVDRRIFSNKNDQEIFKLATLLMIENPLFFMQIGNVWPKKSYKLFLFLFVMHYTSFGSAIKRN